MKSLLTALVCMLYAAILHAQNVGIGTTTPAAKLDVKSTVSSYIGQFNGIAPMYMGIYENDIYRGYWGSYSGAAEDMDFGTGAGTTGKLHLTIQASPRLTIDNTGNVGIGTTSPNYKTHITGGDLFLQSSSGNFIFGYDGSNQWRFATTGGGSHLVMSSFNGTSQTYRHYFDQNGNVGIGAGNISPIARLDVKSSSNSASNNAYMLRNSNNDTILRIRDDGKMGMGINTVSSYGRTLNLAGGMNFYNGYTYSGSMFDNSNGSLTIWAPSSNINLQPSAGTVTIGISTPAAGYLFSVGGKIICEEARVQLSSSWPDYVFAPEYKLRPLDELERLIKLKQHLPDMPPAAQVEKEGLDLGDMNKRLLEKVEELTLYMIDLNKKYETLKESNKQLAAKVNQLQPIKD